MVSLYGQLSIQCSTQLSSYLFDVTNWHRVKPKCYIMACNTYNRVEPVVNEYTGTCYFRESYEQYLLEGIKREIRRFVLI